MEGSEVQGFGRKLYAGLNCWFFNRTNPESSLFMLRLPVYYFFLCTWIKSFIGVSPVTESRFSKNGYTWRSLRATPLQSTQIESDRKIEQLSEQPSCKMVDVYFLAEGVGKIPNRKRNPKQFVSNKLPYASHWLIRPEMFDWVQPAGDMRVPRAIFLFPPGGGSDFYNSATVALTSWLCWFLNRFLFGFFIQRPLKCFPGVWGNFY